jgi:DNA-binding LacI/PurR family transcriptional regulator
MSRRFRLHVEQSSNLPLSGQISEQLAWLIIGGVLVEGDELPPVQELADELGINLHTVRAGYQQLESQGLVSLGRGRRARVLSYDRAGQFEFASGVPSYAIGVIIPEFIQAYAPLLAGIEAEAAKQPALIFVSNAHEDSTIALDILDRLIARGVDGIVVAAALFEPDVAIPSRSLMPVVFIDSPGAAGTSIEFDLEGSQYQATRHLLEHGHRKIGYITPPTTLANVAPKLAGHRRALSEAGIDPDDPPVVEVQDFSIASGRNAALELLHLSQPPTAITAASDLLAVGVYRAAREAGLQIPEDLAVTSNDNSELSAVVDPGLTTVTLPLREAGELAVQSIMAIQDGTPNPTHTVLDVALVVRESCGCELTPQTASA